MREDSLPRAVLRTLVYADLFDYPLTRGEIRRYLIGERAAEASIQDALERDRGLQAHVVQTGSWFHLAGRAGLTEVRRRRMAASARLWPVARRYGHAVALLPFVRLVAVTGALAMDNAERDGDIDLFVLVRPGRLWLCRLLIVAFVRLAARRGHRLCPNFILSTDRLTIRTRNVFTAHEIVQMVPIHPSMWYARFLDANQWAHEFVPNAFETARGAPVRHIAAPFITRLAARLLSSPLFDRVERWEMRRKMRRLMARARVDGGSVAFTAHECRGHFAAHDVRILEAFAARTAEYAEAAD